MKKIQLILAIAAVLAAGAGVLANARASRNSFAIRYYRATDVQYNTMGALCGVEISPPQCGDRTGPQCSLSFTTTVNGVVASRVYYISKIVDNGVCQIVLRNL